MSAEIRWRLTKPVSRPVPASGPRADPDRNPARVLSAIALASLAAGAINVAAAATVGRGSTQDLAFFSVVASAQLVWGVVTMGQAPRWWLALGAAGNLVVVVIWVVSRTAGLPVGEYAGVTLRVGFPDGLATALEAVIVAGAVALMVRGDGPVRSLAGVLSQADAFGSSPAGSGQNGTGGVTGPYAPGTSGGGTSGGGY